MLFAVVLLSLVLAIQAVSVRVTSDFSAHARKNPHYVRNGSAALLNVYSKYNLSPPQTASPAFKAELNGPQSARLKRQDGFSVAKLEDGQHFVYTEIGGQFIHLEFDTASADLWVYTSNQPGRFSYKPQFSPTFKNLKGASWSIFNSDGAYALGTVGTDVVNVGGLSVKNQAVELAVKVTSRFDKSIWFNGVLGLAFSSINQVRPHAQNTFFENAKATLTSPLFAAWLPPQADGSYDFGVLNTSHYIGSISYSPITSPNMFWEVPSTSFKVGDTTYPLDGDTTAIIDTGSSLVLMPDSTCSAYYSQVPGAARVFGSEGWSFPCDAALPDLSVAIGDSYALIPGPLINFSHDDSNTTCFGGLQCYGCFGEACTRNVNVYGSVFLSANYAVFDTEGPRFGFATINSTIPIATDPDDDS